MKNVATVRVVQRDGGSSVDVCVLASDGIRRDRQFADATAADAFRVEIHTAVTRRGFRLVWDSHCQQVRTDDAA